MKEAIQKIFLDMLNRLSDEKIMYDFVNERAPFLLDENGAIDEDIMLENIDQVIEAFLPELSNYKSQDIIEAFNEIEGLDDDSKYQLALMFFPRQVLYDFMRYEYQNNKETFMKNIEIGRDGQIEVLAELGLSYKEILDLSHNYKHFVELYKLDNSLFEEIISKKFSPYSIEEFIPIILNEYLSGSEYVLTTVLEKIGDNNYSSCEKLIDLLIKELVSINRFDVSKLIASLELSGVEFDKFISCVTDENVMRRMIEVEGARALVFCKDFSPEIVELASDFTFDDYKMIDGDYKNSPELLKLISEKYPDKYPVYYCRGGALTPLTADCLDKFGDDTISDVGRVNNSIQHNYLLFKELKKRGKYFSLDSIDNLFTDVNAFNFFIECLSDGTGEFYLRDYGETRIAYYIFNKDYSKLADCRLFSDISKEVAEVIVSLGFDAESYVKYFEHHEELSNIFLEQGHTEVLFMRGISDEYLEAHSDAITYDLYLKLKESNPSFVVGTSLVKKFVAQGHYEILKDIDVLEYADTWDLYSIGLDGLTYDQFLSADPVVRTVPALMLKFREEDPKLFDRYSELFPDKNIVINEKMKKGSFTYDEFMSMTESVSFYSGVEISEELILSYLKEGHIDFISRLDYKCFTPVVLDYIIDNFDIDNLPEKVNSKLNYSLVNRLIEKKDYRFITADAGLSDDVIKKLVASGFTLDDFSKSGYDRIDYLAYYVSKENEDKIIQLVKEYRERKYFYVPLDSSFVLKCIDEGFELENVNYLLSVIDIKIVELLKNLPKDKYDLLNDLEIKNMFVNKTVTDVLLNVLSLEKVKKCLAYCPDDIRMYVIKKMVNLGHNDFIDCYVSGFDEEIVKKALLSGHFPSDFSLANASYRSKITSLKFSKEELDYLRTRLDVCPYLVMFFEDICNDPKLLNEYLIKEPGLLLFFDSDIINNVSLLYEIYKKSEEVFASLIVRSDITNETITNLYLNYDLDYKYIRNKLNNNILENLVVKYPYLVDEYNSTLSSVYLKAFENGYKLNDRTSNTGIITAFQYGFSHSGDELYLEKLKGYHLNDLLSNITYELFINHKDLFLDNYFNSSYTNGYNYSFYSSDEKITRYMNLTFYVSSIPFDSITEDEKKIVVEAFDKFGNSKEYISSAYMTLIRLFGNEFLVKKFLEGKAHISILKSVTINEIDKEAISAKILKDYNSQEYTIDEKIELLSLLRSINICEELVAEICDEFYELYKLGEYRDRLLHTFSGEYLYEKLLSDDSFELTLLDNIRFYDDEKAQLVANRLMNLLQNGTYTIEDYASVCSWYNSVCLIDECNKLAMSVFGMAPEKFSYYVTNPTPEFLETIPNYLREYPSLLYKFDIVLDDKQLVIDLIKMNHTGAYDSATDELKNDVEVCNTLLAVSPDRISSVSLDNPNYREYLKIALIKKGELLESEAVRKPELLDDIELIRIAIATHPNIIAVINKELIDDSLLNLVKDYSLVDFTKIDIDLFEKILVVMDSNGIDEKHAAQIFSYVIVHTNEERLFNNEVVIKCAKEYINNPNLFKQVVILSRNKNIRDSFDAEDAKVMEDALTVLNNTGKIDTLEKNPIFSYDLVKYVYPVVGLEETINLMKYTTNANNELIKLIKDGKSDFVKNYISMLREYSIFENNNKFIHYAFRYFTSIESLIADILETGRVLTDEEISDLKKIILKNRFDITKLSELSIYDTIMVDKINKAFESNDLNAIKNYLSVFFGYGDFNTMQKEFDNFQFGNMAILKYVLNDIKKNYSEDVYNKLRITNEEMALIILMQRIIESNDVKFLRELVDQYIINNENDKDFYDDVQNLTAKFRLIMNYQFNSKLTKFDDKLASAAEYGDTGVKIIEFNGESFNFIAHRLYSYDPNYRGYAEMLMEDPSLWTKLDGASTLSCSSFSDKGFHFLQSHDPNGVVYLFNELPEEFMLFMYGRDLRVQHGGHKMEPTAESNSFTDFDGLNQNSCYHSCRYNEVAGFRNGMIPCAFVCVGDYPNEETIRAAQYFSQMTGKDIPIIKFNRMLYDSKRADAYNRAMSEINNTVSVQLINDCFLSGEVVPIVETTSTILKTLCRSLAEGTIDEKEALACMSELQFVINRSCLGGRESNNAKLALNKIAALKKTMIVMSSLSKEEVIKIETANMGESGIMYKFTEGEDTYLLKPAVDKQKNQGQPFRAEVQEAASKLQKMLNPDSAVEVEAVGSDKFKISKQELIDVDPTKKTYLQEWVSKGGQLDSKIADQLMREYVVDMLLCNFDCFAGNFVIDSSGNLRGIDKEQSFRFIDSPEALKADFSYVPNGDARIPIYQYVFSRYNSGELDISFDAVYETLDALDCLSDADYKSIFEAYAKSLSPDNYEELLEKIVKRKHDVATNIRRYIDSLISKKNAEEFRI